VKLSPLKGKRVLVTRAAAQAAELSRLLEREGAIPVEIPAIEIVPPKDWSDVDRAIGTLGNYRLLILTSPNGVRFFFSRLAHHTISDLPVGMATAAVGERTGRELRERGITPWIPAKPAAVEELLDLILDRIPLLEGVRVLFPRAEKGREILPEKLRKRGASVDLVTVYRTLSCRENAPRLHAFRGEWITFASGSAVEAFFGRGGGQAVPPGVRIAAIGRVTALELAKRGLRADAIPSSTTLEAMVEAMKQVE
jgi:uroporphyrinogen III methyltransferase/synthase